MLPSEMDAKNTICKCTLSELQNIRFSGKYSLKKHGIPGKSLSAGPQSTCV